MRATAGDGRLIVVVDDDDDGPAGDPELSSVLGPSTSPAGESPDITNRPEQPTIIAEVRAPIEHAGRRCRRRRFHNPTLHGESRAVLDLVSSKCTN
jgi:hypothetical protein